MKLAFVGCGFVADFYAQTLRNYPSLEIAGVTDCAAGRAERFGAYYGLPVYRTLTELLADRDVEVVLNLTNPRVHYEVTRACLMAGKHVYSEKPLATDFAQAQELVGMAEERGRLLSSAPCSVLGETAQTLWRALRRGAIGPVRLAYAELDDGLIHRMHYRGWFSDSGSPWPYQDEFEVGCTLEHAGYYVTWLAAFFGPASSVTSYARCLIPDKGTETPLRPAAADFSVAAIEFESGVVARLTCGIVAPHDHSLKIIGDDGVLAIDECWSYGAPVHLHRRTEGGRWLKRLGWLTALPGIGARRLPLVRRPRMRHAYKGTHRMDFARGVVELVRAAKTGTACRLSARFALHVNEIVLAIQSPELMGSPRKLTTTFEPMEPMPWAQT